MRKKIVCGNWKMNTTKKEAVKLTSDIEGGLKDIDIEVVVCPPFVYLEVVKNALSKVNPTLSEKCGVKLGAQNCFFEENGAFTGEISPTQLAEFCSYVILGHSERRQFLKETDEDISKKVKGALNAGLFPIVCLGETKEEKAEGRRDEVIKRQVSQAIEGLPKEEASNLVLAYEPVWAIGTGEVCDVSLAASAIKIIRGIIDKHFGFAQNISVLYGGSVSSSDVEEFAREKEVDGALVGAKSLDAEEFIKIVKTFK